MLPKNRRIPRDILKNLTGPYKVFHTTHFSVRIVRGKDTRARFSVSVSKKVSKKAVARNKVRRRTYSAIGGSLLGIAPGLYLFSAKPGADKIKGDVLRSELESLVVSYRL